MSILLTLHSILRWIVLIIAVALLVRLALNLLQKKSFDKATARLVSAYAGSLDLQATLGLIFLLADGFLGTTGFPRIRWEHGIMLTLAVVAAHMPAAWKKKPDDIRTRNTLIAVIVSLAFIIVGVTRLGAARWFHITGLF